MLVLSLISAVSAHADRVDELAAKLRQDPSYKVRLQAALVLGRTGDARAVPVLIEALRDETDTVRGTAATALSLLGDARAVPALEALRSDSSNFVRVSVERALARLAEVQPPKEGTPALPAAGSALPARHYVMVSVAQGAGNAWRVLRDALAAEMVRVPQVTTRLDGPPVQATLAAHKLTGWRIEGSITAMRLSQGQLDCDVRVAIATLPGNAIRATATAGASVTGASSANDPSAERDCLAGAAQQLAEEVAKFLRTVK